MDSRISVIEGAHELVNKMHDELVTLRSGLPHSIEEAMVRVSTVGRSASDLYKKLKDAASVKVSVEVDDAQGQSLGSASKTVDVTEEVKAVETEVAKVDEQIHGDPAAGPATEPPLPPAA